MLDEPAVDEARSSREAMYRSLTHRQRTSVHREIDRLMQELARGFVAMTAAAPERGLTIQRAPHRCILQARGTAVTVSWFPATYPERSLGELQVMAWRGVVSVPGGTHRAREGASVIESNIFQLIWTADAELRWQLGEQDASMSTEQLVERCLARLELESAPESAP